MFRLLFAFFVVIPFLLPRAEVLRWVPPLLPPTIGDFAFHLGVCILLGAMAPKRLLGLPFLAAIALECIQLGIPSRSFTIFDLITNICGVFLGAQLVRVWPVARQRFFPQPTANTQNHV